MLAVSIQYTSLIYAWLSGILISKAIHITSCIKMQFMDVNAMRIARNSNYRSRDLNSAHHSQKSISRSNVLCHIEIVAYITIVYHCIEFVMKILSIVAWNLSRGYHLSSHRICHVDIVYRHIIIVYCHIVIVYPRINVVTCSSSHSATFRATVRKYTMYASTHWNSYALLLYLGLWNIYIIKISHKPKTCMKK